MVKKINTVTKDDLGDFTVAMTNKGVQVYFSANTPFPKKNEKKVTEILQASGQAIEKFIARVFIEARKDLTKLKK